VSGPTIPSSEQLHAVKYRQVGETFREAMSRIAHTLSDRHSDFEAIRSILLPMRFLPAGRVQSDIGSPRRTTAFNCFVSDTIEDSMEGIMKGATDAAFTMRLGGGIGYDFSTIRPRGDIIVSLDAKSSGPVSFMQIYDAVCKTVSSAGNRRGAQMGVLRVDHPDIEEFVEAKANTDQLTQFNVSVGVTDEFMEAVKQDAEFNLVFGHKVFKRVSARYLWDKIMRATWDWAEPGILFIDRINERNNLYWCETISATNPCGEQPLPPNGACLLGSFNLVKYLKEGTDDGYTFDWRLFKQDIPIIHRAMDNIIDATTYPLDKQMEEARGKRRMGLGVTGVANAGEALGHTYGSGKFLGWLRRVLKTLTNELYRASAYIAAEKGSYPLYDEDNWSRSYMASMLEDGVIATIREHGLRNSHLTSIAPTGTISFAADNVSSGIEPVFAHEYERIVKTEAGDIKMIVEDYGVRELGVRGKTANECTVQEHLDVLVEASTWIDSSVSKTLNVGDDVTWDEFKEIYMSAWERGCKGATTFRSAGKRYGILNVIKQEQETEDYVGGACYIDSSTGTKACE